MLRRLIVILTTLNSAALIAQPTTPLTVNLTSREEARQFYRTIYAASENISSGWTGSYTTGVAGTTSSAFKDAVALRINFFRALAGVSTTVTLDSTFSAKNQQAALMMSANNALQHTSIPTSWTFYTADGAEAAANSNLTIGYSGPSAITAYLRDDDGGGINNASGSHRRWILYPQTLKMGTGDVPGNGTLKAANALWVLDGNYTNPRPTTRHDYVAWPAPGYAPYPLVYARWSFSYAGADFSAATVSVTRGGASVPVKLEPVSNLIGENTLVWAMDNLATNAPITFAQPSADTTYAVTVSNVRIGGVARDFSYNVIVFDPDVAGADFSPVSVAGASAVNVGTASTFNVTRPSFAGAFDWRSLQLAAFSKIYGAEGGLDGLTATTSDGYTVVNNLLIGTGTTSYRLAHVSPRSTQILLAPETFYVRDASAAITLQSRLGIATSIEVARVQVSTDDGVSWVDVFTQTGASQVSAPATTEAEFVSRTLSLAAYVGRTVRVRLAFTIEDSGTAFLPGSNLVGWFIDTLSLTGVQSATVSSATSVASGTSFSFTPTAAGALGLQARGVLFGTYPMEWGTVATTASTEAGNVARITNLSILTSLTSPTDNFTLGYVVGNAVASNPLSLVIRAAGPALGALGVPGTLADPKLETFVGSTSSDTNDTWGGTTTFKSAFAAVGAFPYASDTSKDAAALGSITTRDNSIKVSAADGGTGAVIAEVYDATPTGNYSANAPRLVNVSVLKPIGTSLTVGFVIGGTGSKSVLIRALGPTLATLFGFPTASIIADPKLELFNGASVSIGNNDNWGGTTALTAAFSAAGTFALGATSADAAMTATLAPGSYTVVVSPAAGATGTGLVEVYELP